MTKKIKHLVTSGCSQTADGIGGCPPSADSDGGCSFIDRADGTRAMPQTWAGLVAQGTKVDSFINMACTSAGNFYVSQTLIEVLTKYDYPVDETMVMFNITDPGRLDFICPFDHPDVCGYIPYGPDIMDHAWLSRASKTHDLIKKHMGIENVIRLSCTSLLALFSFLENRNFQYRFIMMRNYLEDTDLGPILKHNSHRLDLDPGIGIVEHSQHTSTLRDSIHPNLYGHELIADQILSQISLKWS